MAEETQLIRDQITETRNHLNENFSELEDQLKQKVKSATDSVAGAFEKVREGVEKMAPRYQIENHPLRTLAGFVAAGVVAGRFFGRRRGRQRYRSTRKRSDSLWDMLSDEVFVFKRAAVGAVINAASTALRNALPEERKVRIL